MSFDVLGDLNWLAVLVATIAYFALGGLWFATPVFGKAWSTAMDWEPPPDYKPSPASYIVPLITCAVATIVVGAIASASATDTASEGLVLGLLVGVGLAFAVVFVTEFFDPKKKSPMTYAAITGGYHVVGLLIVSVILAIWQ